MSDIYFEDGDLHLQKLLRNTEFDIRSYSGRGMYGKECLGIVGHSVTGIISSILFMLKDINDVHYVAQLLDESREDNMGHDMILYFPHTRWEPYSSYEIRHNNEIVETFDRLKDAEDEYDNYIKNGEAWVELTGNDWDTGIDGFIIKTNSAFFSVT